MQPHSFRLAIAAVLLGAGLAACERYELGPAPTTGAPGPAGRPLEQRSFEQRGSAPVSQGSPTLSGGDSSGRPSVQRSGPGSGNLGGAPELQPRGTRSGGSP